MTLDEVKKLINETNSLLPIGTSVSQPDAEKRAGEFLMAMASISWVKHEIGASKIKNESLQVSIFAAELSKGTAKTMTENKVTAEASEIYQSVREAYEGDENDLSYLKAMYEVYSNAHIFYRNLARTEFSHG